MASIRADFPAAEDDWTITASGRSSLRRRRGEIRDELVGLLADDTELGEIRDDARQEIRRAQKLERLLALAIREHDRRLLFRCQSGRDLLLLHRFEPQEQLAEIPLHHLLLDAELERRLLHVGRALPRRVEVQRVDVEALAARSEEAHLQDVIGEIPLEPPHAIAPIPEHELHLVRLLLELHVRPRRRRQQRRRSLHR